MRGKRRHWGGGGTALSFPLSRRRVSVALGLAVVHRGAGKGPPGSEVDKVRRGTRGYWTMGEALSHPVRAVGVTLAPNARRPPTNTHPRQRFIHTSFTYS